MKGDLRSRSDRDLDGSLSSSLCRGFHFGTMHSPTRVIVVVS